MVSTLSDETTAIFFAKVTILPVIKYLMPNVQKIDRQTKTQNAILVGKDYHQKTVHGSVHLVEFVP